MMVAWGPPCRVCCGPSTPAPPPLPIDSSALKRQTTVGMAGVGGMVAAVVVTLVAGWCSVLLESAGAPPLPGRTITPIMLEQPIQQLGWWVWG